MKYLKNLKFFTESKKYIKRFENTNDEYSQVLKCNWCEWFGDEDELDVNKYGDDVCPSCGNDGYIMDVNLEDKFGKDFTEYIKNNTPEKNIIKRDYDNIEEYYKALYPLYFATQKYNL